MPREELHASKTGRSVLPDKKFVLLFTTYRQSSNIVMHLLFTLTLSLCYINRISSSDFKDPYQVLGVSRRATIKEIKHAYKTLAKEWHPDKSEKEDTHEKFMDITRAYEILSDPLKKERFDKFGSFDDPPPSRAYTHHPFDDSFIFGFGGFDNGNSFFQKHRISMRIFSHTMLERSYSQPIIIFAYSGYCQLCFRLEPIWQSVVNDLELLGYGIATVNAITDGNLLEKMRISRLPSIVVVVEGRVIHYRGSMQSLSTKAVRVFARDVIPNTFLIKITNHDGLRRFIDQWQSSNRISVIIFGNNEDPRIRYMLTAMKYATFARFAYIYLSDQSTEIVKMRQALDIKCFKCENILIFNDFPQQGPVARLSISNGQQFSVDAMGTFIEQNKHLTLPRLSSQSYFDDLCPVSSRIFRSFCVILTATDSSSDLPHISSLRSFVHSHGDAFKKERLQFAYVYVNRQKEFIMSFFDGLSQSEHFSLQERKRGLLILWRYDQKKARFAWLNEGWYLKESISGSSLELELEAYVKGIAKLDYQATLKPVLDEYQPSWFTRISRAAVRLFEATWFSLTKEEALPLLSALGTLLIIFLIGYGLSYANTLEEKSHAYAAQEIRKDNKYSVDDDQWHPEDPRVGTDSNKPRVLRKQQRIMREMEPMMHELKAETYFGMIRLLKPGCRSIVVLVDEQAKDILLPQFAKHIWPFRNNKTFSFGYLMVEKNLSWFRKLLEHTLPADNGQSDGLSMYERLKNINPRKTLGTVLVLCGWKLYFNMYHPMHTPPGKKHFLGFDDDGKDLSSEDSDVDKATREETQTLRKGQHLKLEDVLNGLPNWLDRLVEEKKFRGMRCHYDILEIDRNADNDTIKRAYRKLALKWHPDKNPSNVEECNRHFTLVQQAYDILSDPHERAWSICYSGFDERYEDSSLNLFPYFTTTCYSGYGREHNNFYDVYRRVFETLAAEDYEFLDGKPQAYPSFGDQNSIYDDVVGPFYAFWGSFCTVRSFVWMDKFDIREAPNRRVVRAMEKENKKSREAGRRERNEEIRALVGFVRKRDPRAHFHKKELEKKRLEQERRTEENRKLRILEQISQAGEYKESEEVRQSQLENLREIEEALAAEFGSSNDESEMEHNEESDFYCVFCEKVFKTEKAMSNHKKSKKHRDTVALLKQHIEGDDACLLMTDEKVEIEETETVIRKSRRQKRRDRKKDGFDSDNDYDEDKRGPSSTKNETDEMFVESSTAYRGKQYDANADETNIFMQILKKASEIPQSNKTRRRKERGETTKSTTNGTGPKNDTCNRCGEFFESRTKLFAHLRESGHETSKTPLATASKSKPFYALMFCVVSVRYLVKKKTFCFVWKDGTRGTVAGKKEKSLKDRDFVFEFYDLAKGLDRVRSR
uniref:J domain-containing protein n=1 Tax=Setaria digitata TaxID=48799 RepID=A0A915PC95_9BILA